MRRRKWYGCTKNDAGVHSTDKNSRDKNEKPAGNLPNNLKKMLTEQGHLRYNIETQGLNPEKVPAPKRKVTTARVIT